MSRGVLHICCDYSGAELYRCFVEASAPLGRLHRAYVPVRRQSMVGQFPSATVEVLYRRILTFWDRILYRNKIRKIARDIVDSNALRDAGLVHGHTLFSDGGVAYLLNRKRGLPYVITVRNVDINVFLRLKPYLWPFAVRVLEGAQRIVFLSPGYREALFRRLAPAQRARFEAKSEIIPNGVDSFWLGHPPAERRSPQASALRVFYAGHVNQNKNTLGTARACEMLRAQFPDMEFRIAGPVLDEKVGRGLQEFPFIKLLGNLDKIALLAEYRGADVFCMPSFTETFGLVYLEALSQGLPVIYTKGQGFDGHFEEGEVGLAVDARSPDNIAAALARVVQNHDRMSRNGTQRAGEFAWKHVAELAEQRLYRSAIDERPKR
jgi:glycosyltransferase involved in cell wall biosynthesis